MRRKIHVKPTTIGFLFVDGKFQRKLDPGVYKLWELLKTIDVVPISLARQILFIINQEVLSKDGVAFRASLAGDYAVADPDKVLGWIDLSAEARLPSFQIEQRLTLLLQLRIRDLLAGLTSEEAFEKRSEIGDLLDGGLKERAAEFGVTLHSALIRDLTFPKSIQDIFSKPVEARIRSKADLENARTAVATARALKNAAEMMKGDDSLRFLQYLEVIEKVSSKGKHTFVIGDPTTLKSTQ